MSAKRGNDLIHKFVSRAVQQVRQQSRRSDKVSAPKPNIMMMLDRDLVVRLAEEHHRAITIRPDGTIFGLDGHQAEQRRLLEMSR